MACRGHSIKATDFICTHSTRPSTTPGEAADHLDRKQAGSNRQARFKQK
jgi:hypothetical protein